MLEGCLPLGLGLVVFRGKGTEGGSGWEGEGGQAMA